MKLTTAILGVAMLGLIAGPAPAQDKVLNVLSYGGPWNEVQEKTVLERFKMETGYTVTLGSQPVNAVAPIMAAKDNPIYDVVWMPAEDYAALSAAGMLLPLDYANIPNAKDLYEGSALKEGVITSFAAVALVYNKDKVKVAPTSWNDLWNPAYKGHVMVGDLPHSYAMSFLVMTARLNGGGEANIEPGFAKIKQLKPSISGFYKNSGVAAQMFQQGSAWIAPWYHGRAKYMADRGVPLEYVIPKEGAAAYLSVIGVVKGTKNKAIAEKYINMVLQPESQIAWATIIGAGPANKTVKLEPAVAATVPYGDDQIKKLVKLDWATILKNQDKWIERWQREIASP
jgi:putative spermidine/putrescine transport system substrate-binding protein